MLIEFGPASQKTVWEASSTEGAISSTVASVHPQVEPYWPNQRTAGISHRADLVTAKLIDSK
jgi:hypothetical protein